jgi:hypothetical protein
LPLFFLFLAAVGLLGLAQLLFHLKFEVVRGLAELVHELADLAADLGQAAWTKNDESQHHKDERVGHPQVGHHDWRRQSHEGS